MRGFFKSDSGFSLVETMVATAIFALVAGAGVALLSGYQDGRLALSAADDRLADLESARATIRADLMAAVDRRPRDRFGGVGSPFDGGDRLVSGYLMEFVRNGNMGALLAGNVTALERVAYVLEDGRLIRRVFARTDLAPDTPSTDRVLLTGVRSLGLRFDADGIWLPEWRGALADGLPRLAELQLTFENGRILNQTFLVGVGA